MLFRSTPFFCRRKGRENPDTQPFGPFFSGYHAAFHVDVAIQSLTHEEGLELVVAYGHYLETGRGHPHCSYSHPSPDRLDIHPAWHAPILYVSIDGTFLSHHERP